MWYGSDNMRGALFMLGSMAAFTLNDACMKALGGAVPLFQAIFLRGIAVSLFLAALAWWLGAFGPRISRRDWGLIAIRSACEAAVAWFFITALFNMPIANVTAILQVLPLTVALAAWLFLAEPLGWRRLLAIVIGLAGVLLIVRPGTEGFTIYSVYALIAVALITLREIVTRKIEGQVPSMTIALSAALAVTVFGGLGALGGVWAPLDGPTSLKLAGSVFFIMAAYVFSVMAMRIGDVSFAAPFRYSGLLVALILGALVFDEWPSGLTLLGAAIVVGTGLFTLYRERLAMRPGRPRQAR
ncbi:MAG: DMT family transporter [Alphaproteobacteria bacterium]|nr:DMT family transporter [Alphaproteobacteria bacterium]NNF24973.1 DMT family transporter [Paracoccaceae bacterium]